MKQADAPYLKIILLNAELKKIYAETKKQQKQKNYLNQNRQSIHA